jgi:antitoxin YefM
MVSAIRQYAVVDKQGKIELSADLPQGTKVEIIILVEEQDETEYLLSNPANRQYLMQAISNVDNNTNLVTISAEEWNAKYCI